MVFKVAGTVATYALVNRKPLRGTWSHKRISHTDQLIVRIPTYSIHVIFRHLYHVLQIPSQKTCISTIFNVRIVSESIYSKPDCQNPIYPLICPLPGLHNMKGALLFYLFSNHIRHTALQPPPFNNLYDPPPHLF